MIERANATIKELIQKSIELDEDFDWIENLQNIYINNINDSQHRITGFTPNQIKVANKNDDKELLEEASDTEQKKKICNIPKEIFKKRDLLKFHVNTNTKNGEKTQRYRIFKP
jgi:hypothetical protein